MGQNHQFHTATDPTLFTQLIASTPHSRIYRSKEGQLFSKHEVTHNGDQQFKSKYDYRIKNYHNNIVRAYFVNQTNKINIANHANIYQVVIEEFPKRLANIGLIPSEESLYILIGALTGYQLLFQAVGPFFIKDTMIAVDQNNKAKAWINSRFQLNSIEIPYEVKSINISQKQHTIINNILNVVNSHAKQLPAWLNFINLWKSSSPRTFNQSLKLAYEYVQVNQIHLPSSYNANKQSQFTQGFMNKPIKQNQTNSLGNINQNNRKFSNLQNLKMKAIQHQNQRSSKVLHQNMMMKNHQQNSPNRHQQFHSYRTSPVKINRQNAQNAIVMMKDTNFTIKQKNQLNNQARKHENHTKIPVMNKLPSFQQNIIFPDPKNAVALIPTQKNSNIGMQVRKTVSDKSKLVIKSQSDLNPLQIPQQKKQNLNQVLQCKQQIHTQQNSTKQVQKQIQKAMTSSTINNQNMLVQNKTRHIGKIMHRAKLNKQQSINKDEIEQDALGKFTKSQQLGQLIRNQIKLQGKNLHKQMMSNIIVRIHDSEQEEQQCSRIKLQRSRRLQKLQKSMTDSIRLGNSTDRSLKNTISLNSSISRSNSEFLSISYKDMQNMLRSVKKKKKYY